MGGVKCYGGIQPGQVGTGKGFVICNYSVTEKILNKTIKKFLTCHFERSEKSSASKILRMHKISPSGRDDIFFYLCDEILVPA